MVPGGCRQYRSASDRALAHEARCNRAPPRDRAEPAVGVVPGSDVLPLRGLQCFDLPLLQKPRTNTSGEPRRQRALNRTRCAARTIGGLTVIFLQHIQWAGVPNDGRVLSHHNGTFHLDGHSDNRTGFAASPVRMNTRRRKARSRDRSKHRHALA